MHINDQKYLIYNIKLLHYYIIFQIKLLHVVSILICVFKFGFEYITISIKNILSFYFIWETKLKVDHGLWVRVCFKEIVY